MSISKLVGEVIQNIEVIKVHEGGEDKQYAVIILDKEVVTYPARESVYLVRDVKGIENVIGHKVDKVSISPIECCIITGNGVCIIGIDVTKAEKARKEREVKNRIS